MTDKAQDLEEALASIMELWDVGILRSGALTDEEKDRVSTAISKSRGLIQTPKSAVRKFGKRREGMSQSELKWPGLSE